MFSEQQIQKIIDEYNEGYGVSYLAKEYQTYPNKILRLLRKRKVQIRSQAESQRLALKLGTTEHPTKGKKRPEKFSKQISKKIAEYWDGLTDSEMAERARISKENWEKRSDEEIEDMRKKAHESILKSAKEGSKVERHLANKLVEAGFDTLAHKKRLVESEKLEVDILIPSLNLVIEVDGPNHFMNVWGQESLDRVIASDQKKNGLLLSKGFTVLRLRLNKRTGSKIQRTRAVEVTKKFIEDLESGKVKKNTLNILEVKNHPNGK